MSITTPYTAIVIGVSAGGLAALEKILPPLGSDFPPPIFIVQHISPQAGNFLPSHFKARCQLPIKEAEDKEMPQPGVVYFAPPNYHLMLEFEQTLALSTDARVNYSRPSIDILFATAAEAYRENLIAIVLTGANADGAQGMARVHECGGLTIVQSPDTAEADTMPKASIAATEIDHILSLDKIAPFLQSLVARNKNETG